MTFIIEKQLGIALQGMTYPSEQLPEQPLTIFNSGIGQYTVTNEATMLEVTGAHVDTPVSNPPIADFFTPLMNGPQGQQYTYLKDLMKDNLVEISAWIFDWNESTPNPKKIYVVGINNGQVIGWQTTAIQT